MLVILSVIHVSVLISSIVYLATLTKGNLSCNTHSALTLVSLNSMLIMLSWNASLVILHVTYV